MTTSLTATTAARSHRAARTHRAARIAAAVLLGAVLITAVAYPQPARAEDGDVTWGVQPGTPTGPDGRKAFDYQVAPGTVISDWVSVTNSSTTQLSVRVLAQDATTDYDTGAFTLVGADTPSTNVGGWTSVNKAPATCPTTTPAQTAACLPTLGVQLSIGPGERANIPFTLTIPHDASPGDHAGGIAAIVTTQSGGGAGINTPVEVHAGTRIYLRVDGPVKPNLAVTGLVTGYDASLNPFVGGTGRVGFDLVNGGNTRISANPAVTLTGPFGIGLGTWTLPKVANIMPGQRAHVPAELPGVPPLLLLFSDITIAPVAADGVSAASDTVLAPVRVSSTAWAPPWTWLAIAVVLAAVTTLVLWRRRRSKHVLSAELAVYTERIRAEERALASGDHVSRQPDPAAGRHTDEESPAHDYATTFDQSRGTR